jgi:hypothetical protein
MSDGTPGAAVRALLAGAIDYAGLFPPAGLDMREAVSNYAEYQASPDRWALGRFIVPARRLDEFATHASAIERPPDDAPWPLSVLLNDPSQAVVISPFNAQWTERFRIEAVEGKAASPGEVAALAGAVPGGVIPYVEIEVGEDLYDLVESIHEHGASAKLRTGGVTAAAFPSTEHVAQFLMRCYAEGVGFKATAGLHHAVRGAYPLTYEPGSASAAMYGYLNLFLAVAAIRRNASEDIVRRTLLLDEADILSVSSEEMRWSGVDVSVEDAHAVRGYLHGFGACSFREPMEELTALARTN